VTSTSGQFVALLQRAWQGEWYGVRVYSDLAAGRPDAQETAALLELVALETYVLGELTVALFGLGVEPDIGAAEDEAEVDLATHASDGWRDLVRWLKSDAEVALGHYRPLPDLAAGTSLSALADLVVAHEHALISWAERTLAGDPHALDDVRAIVRVDG